MSTDFCDLNAPEETFDMARLRDRFEHWLDVVWPEWRALAGSVRYDDLRAAFLVGALAERGDQAFVHGIALLRERSRHH